MPKRPSNGWKWGASGSFRCRLILLLEFSPGWLHLSGMTRTGNPAPRDQNATANWDLKVFWVLLVSCAPVFIRTGYCVVLLWKQFTRSSGSTRSLLLTHTVRLIAAGGKFCWTSPPGTWLAEVRFQAPLAASEGKKIGESHIRCTFLTQKWHRSHFTCITWATTNLMASVR